MSKSAENSAAIYQEITDRVVKALEQGARPWESVFKAGLGGFPVRRTGEQYTGINRFLLGMEMEDKGYTHPLFLTFKMARDLGAKVRKGEKASLSVFFKTLEVEDRNNSDKTKTIPLIRRSPVFNVAQIDGLSDEFLAKFQPQAFDESENATIERAEKFVRAVPATVIESEQTPHFAPSKDIVSMPNINSFVSSEAFYAVFAHELGHWAGGKSRLNGLPAERTKDSYAFEELIAEMTAAYLCPQIGIQCRIHDSHAPYLEGYLRVLKNDSKLFLKACSQAEKRASYLLAFSNNKSDQKAA